MPEERPVELKKCDNPACDRAVRLHAQYCCTYCAAAHQQSREVHDHSPACDERHHQRGGTAR
jgi:hypothetical protein